METHRILQAAFVLLTFLYPLEVRSAPTVPDPLKPWVGWVSEVKPDELCGKIKGETQCLWPASLSLDVNSKGGKFVLAVTTQKLSPVTLPGGKDVWPLQVRVNSGQGESAVPVASSDAGPQVFLGPGNHIIAGNFSWDKTPDELVIPEDVGVLNLKVNGIEETGLNRLRNGRLSLGEVVGGHVESSITTVALTVFRKISDGIPFQVRTRVLVSASQERTQLKLKDPSPEGTRLSSVQSDLPYYSSDGDLIFAISGGSHSIEFLSVGAVPLSEVKVAYPPAPWPREETWLWEENRDIRVASLQGGTPVDPSIVAVPEDWQGMPSFMIASDARISIEERMSTAAKRAESAITLQRTLVKDVEGPGFTIADELVGTLGGSGRIDLRAPAELGYVAFDGNPQLITISPDTKERGVEIRSQTFNFRANSRMPWSAGRVPAVGWDRDVDWLKLSILSPPGQELLWVRGADNSIGTRFAAWNLSTVFIVLLISIVTGMVVGVLPGIAAGVCFALIHGDSTSLMEVFFLAILAVPIVKRESHDKRWALGYCTLLLLFVFQVYQYSVSDFVARVFPDLTATGGAQQISYEPSHQQGTSLNYDDARIASAAETMLYFAEGSFGALIMAGAGMVAILFFIMRRYRWALVAFGVALGSFMIRSMSATFFNDASLDYSYRTSQVDVYNTIANERGLNNVVSKLSELAGRGSSVGDGALAPEAAPEGAKPMSLDGGQLTVQTGPGMPQWEGRTALATWNGAVPKDLTIELWYLPKWVGIALVLVKVLLELYLIAILWRAIPVALRDWVKGLSKMIACLVVAACIPTTIATAQDSFPPTYLLEELGNRLGAERALSRPCDTNCVSTEAAQVVVSGRSLVLNALVHSVGSNAWALPSSPQGALFHAVLVDGKPAEAARKVEGLTWLLVPNGVHSVEVKGTMPPGDLLSLSFQQSVGKLEFDAPDFKTFVDRSQNAPTAQLMRKASPGAGTSTDTRGVRMEPWFLVERNVSLTHEARTTISVVRLGLIEQEEALSLRLWPTERITRGGEPQDGDTVLVRFKPQETSVSLEGIVSLQGGSLDLQTRNGERHSEVWSVHCSELWRCRFDGLQPTEKFSDGRAVQILRPRPGESSVLKFVRPEGAQGSTQSVVMANLSLEPSTHFLKGKTTLAIRAGQTGIQKLVLPEGASVRGLWVDGRELTYLLNTNARPLEIPIQRGVHHYLVTWQIPQELAWFPQLPQMTIGAPFTNGSINYSVPPQWITLWTSSGNFGPRVTFWITIVMALVGFLVASYFVALPCSKITALVLFVGAWYVSVRTGIYMGVWLYACGILLSMSKRSEAAIREWLAAPKHRWVSYLVLCGPPALIGLWLQRSFGVGPDLGLHGVGTSSQMIRWYFDRGADSIPTPHVLVVPPWVWQVTLLLWSVYAVMMAIVIIRKILLSIAARAS